MKKRNYYSQRTNTEDGRTIISLDVLKRLFVITYNKLDNEGYFQKYFGFYCVDFKCLYLKVIGKPKGRHNKHQINTKQLLTIND